jgi:NTP pyrophosphatase (non-canonical NTP hydrolase)
MRVGCVQAEMRRMFYERDRERGLYATFTWLVEEVGELAEALLSGDRRRIAEEIADVLAWTLSIANLVGVDAEEALASKYGLEGCRSGISTTATSS